MKKWILLLLSLPILFSCRSTKSGQEASGAKTNNTQKNAVAPDWVQRRPISSMYYIGIGMVPKDAYTADFLEEAKKKALADLVSQISVQVATNSVLDRVENNSDISSEYRSYTRTTSSIQLSEYETVDSWTQPGEYWIYLRLSRSRYAELRQQAIENARAKAFDYYKKARAAEAQGNVLEVVESACNALEAVKEYLNEPLQSEYEGKNIFLGNELVDLMNRVFRNVNLSFNQSQLDLKAGRPINTETFVTARYRGVKSLPIRNLPLDVNFTKGDGDLVGNPVTNESGLYLFKISSVSTRDDVQEITITPDVDAIFGSGRGRSFWKKFVDTRNVPSASMLLNVKRPVFYVKSRESNMGSDLGQKPLAQALRERLLKEGFSFAESAANADYIVDIQARSEQNGTMDDLFSATLSLTVVVTDLDNNKPVYTKTWDTIRANQVNYENAGLAAFQKAGREIQLTAVPAILRSILNL